MTAAMRLAATPVIQVAMAARKIVQVMTQGGSRDEDHDIDDESGCGGKSWSFEEGCVAYVEELRSESLPEGDEGDSSEE